MSVQIDSPRILADATQTGLHQASSWLWKPSELPIVIHKARELKIASIGGTAVFLFPEGIYELYWIGLNPGEKAENETWEEYVTRSHDESLALLADQIQAVDFRKLAAELPAVRERTSDEGIDPLDHLYYEFYFNSEQELIDLEKWGRETGFYKHIRRSDAAHKSED